MFAPERPPLLPPATGMRLFEIRRLIDKGLYAQAARLSVDMVDQKGFLYPDPLMPAFDLRIKMSADGPIVDYMRSTNFQTGETTVRWADSRGAFERRLFVSRADGIAVMRITGPGAGKLNCRLELTPREPDNRRFKADVNDVETSADASTLTYRNGFVKAYPGSVQGLEGVARVIAQERHRDARGLGPGRHGRGRGPRPSRHHDARRGQGFADRSDEGGPGSPARPTTPACWPGTRRSTASSSAGCGSTSAAARTTP